MKLLAIFFYWYQMTKYFLSSITLKVSCPLLFQFWIPFTKFYVFCVTNIFLELWECGCIDQWTFLQVLHWLECETGTAYSDFIPGPNKKELYPSLTRSNTSIRPWELISLQQRNTLHFYWVKMDLPHCRVWM